MYTCTICVFFHLWVSVQERLNPGPSSFFLQLFSGAGILCPVGFQRTLWAVACYQLKDLEAAFCFWGSPSVISVIMFYQGLKLHLVWVKAVWVKIECPEKAQNVLLTGWKLYSQNNFKRTVSAWSVNLLRSKRWFKEFFLRTMPKGALCSFFSCKLSEFFAPFCNPGQWPSIFQVLILTAVTSCIHIWINLNGALLLYQP